MDRDIETTPTLPREVLILDEFSLSLAGKTLRRVICDEYLEE
jgi:hypothetical protein